MLLGDWAATGFEMRLQAGRWALLLLALAFGSTLCFAQSNPLPPPAPVQPTYNPALAIHDVQVGKFYMKRDDTDGAIARFKDALLHKPDYAEACLLLGRAYEKKNSPATAIRYYQRYLKILPDTAESRKVRKRIAELQSRMKEEPVKER